MEVILFTAVAIAIYLASHRILQWVESKRATPLKQRQVVFFLIFLVLATTSFEILQRFLASQ